MNGTASSSQLLELASAIVRQLPREIDSITAQGWIENQDSLQSVLKNALCPPVEEIKEPVPVPTPELRVWKTVKLGACKSVKDYEKALKAAGFRIGDYAGQILKKTEVASQEVELDLVRISVTELGFPQGATRQKIYDAASKLGLQICPAEVGPALRLAHPGQSYGEWVLVGMEPITDADGRLEVFGVARDDRERWLDGYWNLADIVWSGFDQWVFVLPRK